MIIVYSQDDETNKLAVLVSSGELQLKKLIEKVLPGDKPYSIVKSLNVDNYFYDAYEYKNKEVVLNISKAKDIHLNNFRKVRAALLQELDLEFLRAVELENKEKQREISVKKMALRDVTKTPLSDDPDEIKKVWPSILGKNPYL